MKFGFTKNAWGLHTHSDDPNNPVSYSIDDLFRLTHNATLDGQSPIVLDIAKFHKNADGDIQSVTDATIGKMTVFPVGVVYTNKDGTEALFWAWTTEDVEQPGGDVVVNLTDQFGQPDLDGSGRQKQEALTEGVKKRSLVLIRFREGDQGGEVILALTKNWGVMFADTKEKAPFSSQPSNDIPSLWGFLLQTLLPPIPNAMAGTITDARASQVN